MAEEKNYFFPMIAIVAIVAIVGIIVMFMQSKGVPRTLITANPGLTIDETNPELTIDEEGNLIGEAGYACTDSDGGKNYQVKGIATEIGNTGTDYCLSDGNLLVEYYCINGNTIASVNYHCNDEREVCKNGACIAKPFCIDTDGGKEYYVKGYIDYLDGPGTDDSDSCKSNTTLVERYCNGNYLATINYVCPYGCYAGSCRISSSQLRAP